MSSLNSIIATKILLFLCTLACVPVVSAQTVADPQPPAAVQSASPTGELIAIVPLDPKNPSSAANVIGALRMDNGRAFVSTNATITSGDKSTHVTMPYRGTMLVCASTTINVAADTSAQAGQVPGLLMAMDAGAVEMSFATTHKADVLLTPDFRILIGGGVSEIGGASEVKVRLGEGGDTCVDNPGVDGSYIEVDSLFDASHYRVDPGQRVMFQHGSMQAVVDQEKEPCGCPPNVATVSNNEFPLAQSEGLAPIPKPSSAPKITSGGVAQTAPPLVYQSPTAVTQTATISQPAPAPHPVDADAVPITTQDAHPAAAPPVPPRKPNGVLRKLGGFFKRIFGSE